MGADVGACVCTRGCRHLEVVKFLTAHGAEVDAKDKFGLTPVEWARRRATWRW